MNCGRFTKVINIWFECQPHNGNRWLTTIFQFKLQTGIFYFFCTPKRFVVICFTRLSNHTGLHWKVSSQEVRVDSNTVSTYTTTRLKDIDTWVLIRQSDQVPYVNVSLITDKR